MKEIKFHRTYYLERKKHEMVEFPTPNVVVIMVHIKGS